MNKKKFPNIRALVKTPSGYEFGAFKSTQNDAEMGYTLFIPNESPEKDWCECDGYVHGKRCYHVKEARRRVEVNG